MHILVIDDEDAICHAVEFCLSAFGVKTSTAANGREGLRLCQSQCPDVVLTDIVMPQMEGLESIRALRRLYPTLPIIAMSGSVPNKYVDYLKVAQRFGANAILRKPFEMEELLCTIKTLTSTVAQELA